MRDLLTQNGYSKIRFRYELEWRNRALTAGSVLCVHDQNKKSQLPQKVNGYDKIRFIYQ